VHDDQLDPMFDAIRDVQALPSTNTAANAMPIPMVSHFGRK
jgi:hypothetical protein